MTAKPVTIAEIEACACPSIDLRPHPDGQSWTKCCGSKNDGLYIGFPDSGVAGCMCLMRKPETAASRYDFIMGNATHPKVPVAEVIKNTLERIKTESGRFFCVHRTDDGFHRECAGWAAKYRKSP